MTELSLPTGTLEPLSLLVNLNHLNLEYCDKLTGASPSKLLHRCQASLTLKFDD